MTPDEIKALGNQFYRRAAWRRVRDEVLRLDRYECQRCKARGRYSRAVVVHHVKHLEDRPELALSVYDENRRQLISVCKRCHEELHPDRIEKWKYISTKAKVTDEKWE